MTDNNSTVNKRTKNALCYIPLAAFFIYFTETKKSVELNKHIRYGIILFIGYSLLSFVVGWLFGGLLFVVYLGISLYLGFKAYNGEDINIEAIDNFQSDKSNNKKESSDKDDDVLNF